MAAAGPKFYGMTDNGPYALVTLSSLVLLPYLLVEMMGFLGMGNNPMVGATAVAVAIEEAMKK